MQYETIIGLEVHVELGTESKIFCSCTTKFGGEPNTHCCPVCTGMPGTLPVLNKKVLDYSIKAGLATNCSITPYTKFDRKNYFYPDLPKAYQVSQLYMPVCQEGYIDIEVNGNSKTIGIREIHMEEDAGKLIHDPWEDCTLVDYNRCGVPLIEIVSNPDMRTAEEAIAYLTKLRTILRYIGISDCKMQEGSFRADINLSVRPIGTEALGVRTEMKNMNSFKAISRAIEMESLRQIDLLESGKKVVQETRRWDDNKDASFAMRSKENAQDYRYFPEPDLIPMEISPDWIDGIRKDLPELPDAKRSKYVKDYGLPEYDTQIITSEKKLADIFDGALAVCNKPKEVSNWIMGDLLKLVKENNQEADDVDFSPENLGKMIQLIDRGTINRNIAKKVFEKIYAEDVDPEQYIKQQGLIMVSDEDSVRKIISQVLAANTKSIEDLKNGKDKAFGFLVGQVMKELKGKADPVLVNGLLKEELQNC
jgi:aspartyl-tRNA(Asn)/glutamyl-tRNA(Gln) amidotransferase subunit B